MRVDILSHFCMPTVPPKHHIDVAKVQRTPSPKPKRSMRYLWTATCFKDTKFSLTYPVALGQLRREGTRRSHLYVHRRNPSSPRSANFRHSYAIPSGCVVIHVDTFYWTSTRDLFVDGHPSPNNFYHDTRTLRIFCTYFSISRHASIAASIA